MVLVFCTEFVKKLFKTFAKQRLFCFCQNGSSRNSSAATIPVIFATDYRTENALQQLDNRHHQTPLRKHHTGIRCRTYKNQCIFVAAHVSHTICSTGVNGARRQKINSLYREFITSCAQFLERGFNNYLPIVFYIWSKLLFGRGFPLYANLIQVTF